MVQMPSFLQQDGENAVNVRSSLSMDQLAWDARSTEKERLWSCRRYFAARFPCEGIGYSTDEELVIARDVERSQNQ